MILCFTSAIKRVDACCAKLCEYRRTAWRGGTGQLAQWVVRQWQLQLPLYERSLCSLLELQARKRSYSMCCSPRYLFAQDYPPEYLLPLSHPARHSPPPAHL